ncbi:HtaA domain-containing protein [Pseudonocardia humida]|uniref:HtaA domain-containing protein n=1 Tax=Pseudonocardia humida TaxID=2800819 RepID=A0ABT0ZTU9_9PSEU|nr:HtaA domain-containing protein [Pseudonocardia humida]MCO1654139.1 HtaA domain-containing protein [Pseudonocardia humida]
MTVAVGAAGLAVATPATAATAAPATVAVAPATDPHEQGGAADLQGGRTTLKLDEDTAALLADNGVSVTPTGDAHAKGGRISFPVTGGSLDPATTLGTVEHSGGLEFSAGDVSLGVQDFVIDTAEGVLTARVSGTDTRVPLLALDASEASVEADDKGVTVRGVSATLTAEAAAALNETFGVSLFSEGVSIGTAKVVACI